VRHAHEDRPGALAGYAKKEDGKHGTRTVQTNYRIRKMDGKQKDGMTKNKRDRTQTAETKGT